LIEPQFHCRALGQNDYEKYEFLTRPRPKQRFPHDTVEFPRWQGRCCLGSMRKVRSFNKGLFAERGAGRTEKDQYLSSRAAIKLTT
jgi:hypothetical protein